MHARIVADYPGKSGLSGTSNGYLSVKYSYKSIIIGSIDGHYFS